MDSGGYFILFNGSSGNKSKEGALRSIKEGFSAAKAPFEIAVMEPAADFLPECRRLVEAAAEKKGVVVAAGGDGTVSMAAALCSRPRIPLGIIPLGTFNYFARNLNIPLDANAAIDVIRAGHTREVPLGRVGDNLFINNATIGFYKDLIEAREHHKARFGRLRVVALFSALTMFVRGHKSFLIKLKKDAQETTCRTTMLFAGINRYQLQNIGLPIARCTEEKTVGALVLKELSGLQTVLLLARGILGELETDPNVEFFCSESFEVSTTRQTIDVVVDGEIVSCSSPLSFSVDPAGLTLLAPPAV